MNQPEFASPHLPKFPNIGLRAGDQALVLPTWRSAHGVRRSAQVDELMTTHMCVSVLIIMIIIVIIIIIVIDIIVLVIICYHH